MVLFAPLLPVLVFATTRHFTDVKWSLLGTLFIMGQPIFMWSPNYARVVWGLIFYAFALLIVISNLDNRWKYVLLPLVSTGIVFSHYGTTFCAIFILGITLIIVGVRWLIKRQQRLTIALFILLAMLVPMVALSYAWHYRVNVTPAGYALSFIKESTDSEQYSKFTPPPPEMESSGTTEKTIGFWSLESREFVIQVAFGKTLSVMSIPRKVIFGVIWLLLLAMTVCLALVLVRRKFNLFSGWMLASYCTVLLTIVVPYISNYYGISRVFAQSSIVLVPYALQGTQGIKRGEWWIWGISLSAVLLYASLAFNP